MASRAVLLADKFNAVLGQVIRPLEVLPSCIIVIRMHVLSPRPVHEERIGRMKGGANHKCFIKHLSLLRN